MIFKAFWALVLAPPTELGPVLNHLSCISTTPPAVESKTYNHLKACFSRFIPDETYRADHDFIRVKTEYN